MFAETVVETWDDVGQLSRDMKRWAFRGQSSAIWSLDTALERAARVGGVPRSLLANREFWILRQFQRRAHIVISSPPDPSCTLEWLALIQHYGGPTRLLDFTHSVYVAAFFALELAEGDAAIWAVNLAALDVANKELRSPHETIDDLHRRYIARAEGVLGRETAPRGAIYVEPERLNERMAIQRGVFLLPQNLNDSFMDNLAYAVAGSPWKNIEQDRESASVASIRSRLNSPASPHVVKIILPRDMHWEAMDDLTEMNITANTLFPGLEGFARSLHLHVRYLAKPEVLKALA